MDRPQLLVEPMSFPSWCDLLTCVFWAPASPIYSTQRRTEDRHTHGAWFLGVMCLCKRLFPQFSSPVFSGKSITVLWLALTLATLCGKLCIQNNTLAWKLKTPIVLAYSEHSAQLLGQSGQWTGSLSCPQYHSSETRQVWISVHQ